MPPSHRSLRIAEAIREVVSSAVLFQVSDPRVRGVTVLSVEVASDMRSAVVYVTVMGEPAEQEQAMKGLQSARGYLQSLVADRLQTRFTPILSFKRDEGVKRSVEMSKLIDETLEADRRNRGIGGEGAPDEESRVDDSEDDPSDEDFDDEEDLDEPDEDSELEDDLADDDPSVPAPRTGLESRDPRPDDED